MAFDLFGNKEKQAAVENEILQKLSRIPLLDSLIEQLLGEDLEDWMTTSQNYYDSRERVVEIEADSFKIKWRTIYYEDVQAGYYQDGTPKTETRMCEKVHANIEYSYTNSGYLPLHAHYNEKGKEDVSVGRVCYLWASIIRERMAARMPDCRFGAVEQSRVGAATFTYTVPALTFKDWF